MLWCCGGPGWACKSVTQAPITTTTLSNSKPLAADMATFHPTITTIITSLPHKLLVRSGGIRYNILIFARHLIPQHLLSSPQTCRFGSHWRGCGSVALTLSQASKFVQHSSPWSPHHVYILQVYSSRVQYSSQIILLNYIFTDVLIPSQGLLFFFLFILFYIICFILIFFFLFTEFKKQVKCSLKYFCLPICQVLLPVPLGAAHSGSGVGCHTWGRLPVPPARTLHAHKMFSSFN